MATLQFAADGSVRVQTGCNQGTGRVQIDGRQLRFSQIALTKRACVGAAGQMESAVLAVLGAQQVVYQIEAWTLSLRADGRGLQLSGS